MTDIIVNYQYVEKLPIVILDNIYTPSEVNSLLKECEYLHDRLLGPEQTHSAKKDGKTLKQNSGIYLENFFIDKKQSSIHQITRKIFTTPFGEMLQNIDTFFEYYIRTNADNTLLSYYENSDFYEEHVDVSLFTMCTWIHKTPKAFTGGDFIINGEIKVDCENNRCVIFPSILKHKVTPVTIEKINQDQIKGRFTISQFASINI